MTGGQIHNIRQFRIAGIIAVLMFCCTAAGPHLYAGAQDHIFEQGNGFYQNEQYSEALNAYNKINETGYESGSLEVDRRGWVDHLLKPFVCGQVPAPARVWRKAMPGYRDGPDRRTRDRFQRVRRFFQGTSRLLFHTGVVRR